MRIAMSDFNPAYTDYIRKLGIDVISVNFGAQTPADSIAQLRDIDAVVAFTEDYSAQTLEALKGSLKIVVRHGVGYDRVDLKKASELGICCCNTPGSNAKSVAETALTMILEMAHGYYRANNIIAGGGWPAPGVQHEISALRVGLIGFGTIARHLARLLKPFGCTVCAFDPKFDAQQAAELGVEFSPMEEIAETSDIISLHLPLMPETRGMINADFISKMKREAVIVNTARGGLIQEEDLIQALKEGRIAGAALDVMDMEPAAADNPLRKMDNVFITPHMAGNTVEAGRRGLEAAVKAIEAYKEGRIPPNCLNPDYVHHLRR